jgi:hypothetical protein
MIRNPNDAIIHLEACGANVFERDGAFEIELPGTRTVLRKDEAGIIDFANKVTERVCELTGVKQC